MSQKFKDVKVSLSHTVLICVVKYKAMVSQNCANLLFVIAAISFFPLYMS